MSDPTDADRIADIRARAEKATPLPTDFSVHPGGEPEAHLYDSGVVVAAFRGKTCIDDARFHLTAKADVLHLLDRLAERERYWQQDEERLCDIIDRGDRAARLLAEMIGDPYKPRQMVFGEGCADIVEWAEKAKALLAERERRIKELEATLERIRSIATKHGHIDRCRPPCFGVNHPHGQEFIDALGVSLPAPPEPR